MIHKGFEHEQLEKFAGHWITKGRILATDNTPEISVSGTDTYEWLPGEFFLLHKVDVFVGQEKNETFEIIGYDNHMGKYTMQYYDNKGSSGSMTATFDNGVWIFLGETLKFTGGFKNEDQEFSGIWEQLTDGRNWIHFMDIRLAKVIEGRSF